MVRMIVGAFESITENCTLCGDGWISFSRGKSICSWHKGIFRFLRIFK
jgi:hypothetical protein